MGGRGARAGVNVSGTASVAVLKPMLGYARDRGVDVGALLDAIGLAPAALEDFDLRISEAKRVFLWTEAPRRARDPSFGLHVATHAEVGAYDVLDYALYFSETLGDALRRALRFYRVLCDAWAIEHVVEGDVVRIRRVEKTPRHEAEESLALVLVRARALSGRRLVPREVHFAHPAPDDRRPHAALFRCKIHFGSAVTEIVLRAKDLELPVRSADPGVVRVLDRYMNELLARLPAESSFLEHARVAVRERLLAGRPTLRALAAKLRASPRTIQRRLDEHGTTFVALVERERRDRAEKLLADGRRSVTEIAFLLGFADAGSFRRAHRGWTGTSPSRARVRRT